MFPGWCSFVHRPADDAEDDTNLPSTVDIAILNSTANSEEEKELINSSPDKEEIEEEEESTDDSEKEEQESSSSSSSNSSSSSSTCSSSDEEEKKRNRKKWKVTTQTKFNNFSTSSSSSSSSCSDTEKEEEILKIIQKIEKQEKDEDKEENEDTEKKEDKVLYSNLLLINFFEKTQLLNQQNHKKEEDIKEKEQGEEETKKNKRRKRRRKWSKIKKRKTFSPDSGIQNSPEPVIENQKNNENRHQNCEKKCKNNFYQNKVKMCQFKENETTRKKLENSKNLDQNDGNVCRKCQNDGKINRDARKNIQNNEKVENFPKLVQRVENSCSKYKSCGKSVTNTRKIVQNNEDSCRKCDNVKIVKNAEKIDEPQKRVKNEKFTNSGKIVENSDKVVQNKKIIQIGEKDYKNDEKTQKYVLKCQNGRKKCKKISLIIKKTQEKKNKKKSKLVDDKEIISSLVEKFEKICLKDKSDKEEEKERKNGDDREKDGKEEEKKEKKETRLPLKKRHYKVEEKEEGEELTDKRCKKEEEIKEKKVKKGDEKGRDKKEGEGKTEEVKKKVRKRRSFNRTGFPAAKKRKKKPVNTPLPSTIIQKASPPSPRCDRVPTQNEGVIGFLHRMNDKKEKNQQEEKRCRKNRFQNSKIKKSGEISAIFHHREGQEPNNNEKKKVGRPRKAQTTFKKKKEERQEKDVPIDCVANQQKKFVLERRCFLMRNLTKVKKVRVTRSNTPHESSNIDKDIKTKEEEVIRCICGIPRDEGLMIQCERCTVWQHCRCVKADQNCQIYVCEECVPRKIDYEIPLDEFTEHGHRLYMTLMRGDLQLRQGDTVYVLRDVPIPGTDRKHTYKTIGNVANSELDIFRIEALWKEEGKEEEKQRFAYGHHYLRPHETFHEPTRKFYPNEVVRVPLYEAVPVDLIAGRCWVMDPTVYRKGRPRGAVPEHCYICEYRVDKAAKIFSKASKSKFPICVKSFAFERFTVPLKITRTYSPHHHTQKTGKEVKIHKREREEKSQKNKEKHEKKDKKVKEEEKEIIVAMPDAMSKMDRLNRILVLLSTKTKKTNRSVS